MATMADMTFGVELETFGLGRTRAIQVLGAQEGWRAGMVPGGTTAVRGEVYRVDERTRDVLDRMEGHPSFYVRTRIRLANGRIVETYLLDRGQVAGRPRITTGDWRRQGKGNRRKRRFSFE